MNTSTREKRKRTETVSNQKSVYTPSLLKIPGPVPYRNLITMNILRRKRRSFRIFNASKFLFPTTTQIWVIMCYYVQRVSDHTEHRLAPISEASVLLQEYRCLFSMHFRRPMPIIEQKYQDCCAICLKIPLESARYYAIIIKKERISIKYKRNFRLFSRTTRQRPCWHENLTTAGRDNGPNA